MSSLPLRSAPVASTSPSLSSPLPRWALPALLTLFALLAIVYSVVTPAFETPDEIWHYAFIQYLASGQGLPVSTPHTDALWRQQGTQSPGYYLAAAALTWWIDQSDFPALYARQNPHAAIGRADRDGNINRLIHYSASGVSDTGVTEGEGWPWHGALLALHIARLFSVLLGIVTLWASYRTVTLILGPLTALVGTAVLAFTPQFIFVSGAASNDNMVNALAALVIWLLVALIFSPPSAATRPRRFALLGVVLGLAALSKLSALGSVGLAGLTLLGLAWQGRSWRVILDAFLWVGLPVALIAGWWFARNVLLYHDPLAWNLWEANILLRTKHANVQTIISELGSLFQSDWGLFGWLNLPYPDWVYLYFEAISVIILLGCLVAVVRCGRRLLRVDAAWLAVALLLLWLLLLIVSWLRFMIVAPAAQGRYFFPAAPTLIFIAGLGLSLWRRWRIDTLVVISLALLAVATPRWLIAPAYAAPPSVATLPTSLTPVEVPFEGGLTLIGIDAPQVDVHPGDMVTVTAAWRADTQPSRDLSVFVHLVDGDDLIAAQVDTMPSAGLSPTSQWQTGEVHIDRYHISIPPTAYTPSQTRVAIGLYDALAPQQPRQLVLNEKVNPGPGVIEDKSFVVGQVAITPPAGEVPNQISMHFEDNMVLVGYRFNQRYLHPGDTLTVTLYWQASGPVGNYYKIFVHLLDSKYAMFGGNDSDPKPGTLAWKPGAIVEDVHSFTVPDNTQAGSYRIELGLYDIHRHRARLLTNDEAEGATNLLLGPLEVKDKELN